MILAAGVSLQFDKTRCAGFSQEKWWQHSMAVEHEKPAHQAGVRVSQMDADYLCQLGLSDQCNPWREICGFQVKLANVERLERIQKRADGRQN